MASCRYTRADSPEAAIGHLVEAEGDAHVIAGGIALGILMNEKVLQPTWLIDIAHVQAFRGIELQGGAIRIGALETHSSVERSPVVLRSLPMLSEMAAEIACGRIKHRGTIGGNICLADPQGDPPVAAIALRATLRAIGPSGLRDIPATEFFKDLYTTALGEDELLQELRVPLLPAHSGAAFGKFAARRAMDYSSTISVAVRLAVDPASGAIADLGLGFGGVGLTPVWPKRTEAVFAGRKPGPELYAQARETLSDEIVPLEDHLYSADYKRHAAAVILERTVEKAYRRATADRGGART